MAGKKKKAKAEAEAEAEDNEDRKSEGKGEDESDGEGEGSVEESSQLRKKLSGRTLVLFIALPAVVVIGAGLGAAFFFGLFGGKADKAEGGEGEDGQAPIEHAVFFDLPELLVNLSSGADGSRGLLKITVALEVDSASAVPKIEAAMPRIIDGAQVFLRELRIEDLDGSAAILQLRDELTKRVNAAVAPVVVRDVLFKEIIVQ